MEGKTEFVVLQEEMGLNNRELSEKLGVSERTIIRWRTGEVVPPKPIMLLMKHLAMGGYSTCLVKM